MLNWYSIYKVVSNCDGYFDHQTVLCQERIKMATKTCSFSSITVFPQALALLHWDWWGQDWWNKKVMILMVMLRRMMVMMTVMMMMMVMVMMMSKMFGSITIFWQKLPQALRHFHSRAVEWSVLQHSKMKDLPAILNIVYISSPSRFTSHPSYSLYISAFKKLK